MALRRVLLMPCITYKPFMLSVVMIIVIVLSVIMLSVIMLSVILLNGVTLSVAYAVYHI